MASFNDINKKITEKDVVESHINGYVERITDLSKYISGSPSFTTYYNKDILASSADMGLKGVHEIVGSQSPIKYNKIVNFPIYNIPELNIDIDTDEDDGTITNIEGEGVILSDCGITPMVDDIFVLSYDKRKLAFRVTDVQISSIYDKVLYKISFSYEKWDLSLLDENQISKEYETRYDNIGNSTANGNVIIEKTVSISIEKLKDFYNKLRDKYITLFYNKDLNTFVCEGYDSLLYDNYLMEFIKRGELFIEKKSFNKNIYIEPLLGMNGNKLLDYENTFYYYLEEDEYIDYSEYPKYMEYVDIQDKFSMFQIFKNQYGPTKKILYYDAKIPNFIEKEQPIAYVVARYMIYLNKSSKSNYDLLSKEKDTRDLIEDILDFKFNSANEENYMNVPMVLGIIKKVINILETLN